MSDQESAQPKLPPLDSGLVDFPLRDNAADLLNQVAIRQCRERQLLSALAENESLKEQLAKSNEESDRYLTQAFAAEGNAVFQQRRAEKAEAERDALKEQLVEWLKRNGPGGWIDNLRIERDKALKVIQTYREGSAHQFCLVNTINGRCPTCIQADELLKEKP